ncbi:auxin-responsive protein SAUR71-like [Musa acuminata AAA Group]|uniref:auxin-responsive protein SAUR71-like n=1 Tax=Musa acuminata AAA Group TaxID=214697 RepID=UPI0031D3A725
MIRRLSRVVDCAQYESLRWSGKGRRHGEPAQGHFPVYVGEEMERFEVRTELLARPAFVRLLRLSADEYGYEQRGVLRIPCPVPLFRRLLAAASSTEEEEEKKEKEKELLRSFPELLLGSSDRS